MIQTSEGNLPQGLDAAIRTGLERGRRTVARRARVRRGAVRSALCLALVLGLFAGGVNASPAFAAAMEELPILGRLVQVFRVNAPSVDGGQTAAGSRAALTLSLIHIWEGRGLSAGRAVRPDPGSAHPKDGPPGGRGPAHRRL